MSGAFVGIVHLITSAEDKNDAKISHVSNISEYYEV